MTVYHLGMDSGRTPFCYGRLGTGPVKPCYEGPLVEPDTWCPKCLAVWDQVHPDLAYPYRVPLKVCIPLGVPAEGYCSR